MMRIGVQTAVALVSLGLAACSEPSPAAPTNVVPVTTPTSFPDFSGAWHGTMQDDAGRSGQVNLTLLAPVAGAYTGVWTSDLSEPLYSGGSALAFGNPGAVPGLLLVLTSRVECPAPLAGLPPSHLFFTASVSGSATEIEGTFAGSTACGDLTSGVTGHIDLHR